MIKRKVPLFFTALILSAAMLIQLTAVSFAITGETSRAVEEITLPDGTKTGVSFTQAQLSGYYGDGKVVSFAECDLSDTHLSIEVINCGSNTVGLQTMPNAIKSFNNSERTVLAAVNGDLWMTSASSTSSITKKVLRATRGALVIDREVWATQEIEKEVGIGGGKLAFGVTSQNQPLVGIMDIAVSLTDETKGVTLTADGINRLPADNAIIIYNSRLNSTNYALNDSYEIELTAPSTAFRFDAPLTATVKAIYPSGSTTRPAIGSGTIVITVRGSRISEVSSVFSVGDTVTFNTSVTDRFGNTELWNDVVDAIGGHMMPLKGSEAQPFDTSKSEYPTTLIGVKPDGKVMFCTVSYKSSGVYKGLRFYQAVEFCREMGYSDVFYLDGGGSSTMVTLKEGSYTVRNCTSDGSTRSVINGVAMVWNNEPVCEKQGDLGYLVQTPFVFDCQKMLDNIYYSSNNSDIVFDSVERAAKLTVTKNFNPYVRFDVSGYRIKNNQFPYAVVTYRIPTAGKLKTGQICVDTSDAKVRELQIASSVFTSPTDGTVWCASILDLSKNEYMMADGTYIEKIRLDPFDSGEVGAEFFLDSICFCRSVTAANEYAAERLSEKNGPAPDGTQLLLSGNLPIASQAYAELGRVTDYGYGNFTASFDMAFFEEGAIGCYYICDGAKYIYISQNEIGLGDTNALIQKSPVHTNVTSFDWGEASALNFHRVSVRIDGGDAAVYIDGKITARINGAELYGNGASVTDGQQKLGTCAAVNVMFDNFVLYDENATELLRADTYSVKSTSLMRTLFYSMNGGAGSVPKAVFVTGNNTEITSYEPRHSTFSFKGWSENSSAKNADFTSGMNISRSYSPTLYAVWEAPHEHSWNEGVITVVAGCETEGVKTYTCTSCSAVYTESIPPQGHEYDSGTVTVEPTCTSAGEKTFTCLKCGKTKTESVASISHLWSDPVVTVEPTYTSTGTAKRTCQRCQVSYNIVLPVLDPLAGDVDGDFTISVKDLKLLTKYLLGIVSEDDIYMMNADIDSDDFISTKDSKALKIIILNE